MPRAQRHIEKMPERVRVPGSDAEIVFEEYLLRRAVRDRVEAERRLSDAIAIAKEAGLDWASIGQILGVGPRFGRQHLDQAS